jgi:hypothetical protein
LGLAAGLQQGLGGKGCGFKAPKVRRLNETACGLKAKYWLTPPTTNSSSFGVNSRMFCSLGGVIDISCVLVTRLCTQTEWAVL